MTSRSGPSSTWADRAVQELHREDWGRLLSLLVSRTRRLDLAEDALSEAFARAVERWPRAGIPADPAGWVYTTAHRHLVGRLRAEAVAGRKAPLLAVRSEWHQPDAGTVGLGDDRLELILLCCHPALPRQARSALALRLVLGTSTDQIARLFLVPTPTMAARITRAKKKIAVAGIPLGSPAEDELAMRLDEVCRTVYLAFTVGYSPGTGPDLLRIDEAGEAVRLAAVLHDLVPEAAQVRVLLALLVLQHARRDARLRDGRLVTLAEQDRTRWHHDEIATGLRLLDGADPGDGYLEELRLQALIAASHARASSAASTDWNAIADHYGQLEARTGSPVVRLNRAVAVAEVEGPAAGLSLLDGLDELMPANHRVPSVRAELARRAGDTDRARAAYRRALDLCGNDAERAHLQARLDALGG